MINQHTSELELVLGSNRVTTLYGIWNGMEYGVAFKAIPYSIIALELPGYVLLAIASIVFYCPCGRQ